MGRGLREIIKGQYYHVMSRSCGKKVLFKDNQDYLVFYGYLSEAVRLFGWSVYHYVIMPTHFHLLAKAGMDEVSSLLKYCKQRYSAYYSAKYDEHGNHWQAHPKIKPIESEEHFLSCGRYIEANPVRAKLAPHAGKWFFSSFGHYGYGRTDMMVTTDPRYLSNGWSAKKRMEHYRMSTKKSQGFKLAANMLY